MLERWTTTGDTATARRDEAEADAGRPPLAPIARLLVTLDAVDEAADSFDLLMEEDGAALRGPRARAAFGQAATVIDRICAGRGNRPCPFMISILRRRHRQPSARVVEEWVADSASAFRARSTG